MSSAAKRQTLRLLSFNIQVGINSRRYADYITSSWQHILPNNKRMETLHAMSRLMKDYDIVALQEADGGSIRSNFINQVSLLAQFAGFSYWHQQCNRNLGRIAQHSNG
ncbi:MAG: EEP domain-containing protein, partial [Enterobacterales bacterium]|nr:EEP domain-containing protein [Enterobacterales bacterium]